MICFWGLLHHYTVSVETKWIVRFMSVAQTTIDTVLPIWYNLAEPPAVEQQLHEA